MFNIEQMRQILSNPYGNGIRNYISEILKEKYPEHESVIEKITEHIKTEKDYKSFGSFVMALYGKGYTTAVEQHKEALAKYGMKANIIDHPEKSG